MKPAIRKQSGFTLIELMITIAIVGILAAIAIPSYASFTSKSAGSEAIRMLDAAEPAVAESYASTGVGCGNASECGSFVNNRILVPMMVPSDLSGGHVAGFRLCRTV